jgi:hypothetical protein
MVGGHFASGQSRNFNSETHRPAAVAKTAAGFPAAQKNEEAVPCPVNTVRTEIITSLPSPWWQTPQEGRLVGTRVASVAGRRTLVCEYSAYGTKVAVMREFPSGAIECRPTPTGFRCR